MICTLMFIAALPTTAVTHEQPNARPRRTGEEDGVRMHSGTLLGYEKGKTLPCAAARVYLWGTEVSEISHVRKDLSKNI